MGNCLKPQSRKRHVESDDDDGEDWSWARQSPPAKEEKRMGDFGGKMITEVKIKISKKQLEELLRKMEEDVKEIRAHEVLSQLMSHSKKHSLAGFKVHQSVRPWRPALQSIPEVN